MQVKASAPQRAIPSSVVISAGSAPGPEVKSTSPMPAAWNHAPTLREVLRDYFETRKRLTPSTRESYEYVAHHHLADVLDVPISQISKDWVMRKNQELSEKFSPSTCNSVMRVLRALLNFGICRHDLVMTNVVKVLSTTRSWSKEKRRSNYIPDEKQHAWYLAVNQLHNKTARDYLLFLALTGLRREEAAHLLWANVDLVTGKFCVERTKNGEDHFLPLAAYTWNMLRDRQKAADPNAIYVFPGKQGRQFGLHPNHLRQVSRDCGHTFVPHDLRRGFLACGDALGVELTILKSLANHKQPQDVTLRYLQRNVNRLRAPAELIASRMVELWQVDNPELVEAPPVVTVDVPKVTWQSGKITRTEKAVLSLIAAGLSNKSIAQRLGVSLHTVEAKISNLHAVILGPDRDGCTFSIRTLLAMTAVRRGLVDLESCASIEIAQRPPEQSISGRSYSKTARPAL